MLYFIKSEDTQKDTEQRIIVKIGVSKNPSDRLKELQTGNHNKLTLIKIIECDNYRKLESEMHKFYKQNNKIGEWFEFSVNEFSLCMDKAQELANKINNDIKTKKQNNLVLIDQSIKENISEKTESEYYNNFLSNCYDCYNNKHDDIQKNNLFAKPNTLQINYFESHLFLYKINKPEDDCVSISNSEKQNFMKYVDKNNKHCVVKITVGNTSSYAILKDFCFFDRTIVMSDKLMHKLNTTQNSLIKVTMASLNVITTILVYVSENLMTENSSQIFSNLVSFRNILYKNEVIGDFIIGDVYSDNLLLDAGIYTKVCTIICMTI